jgi:DNA-binding MarR family transcriptional regulator
MLELGQAWRTRDQSMDAFDEAASQRLGVNRTDLRCMDLIATAESMTAGELAQASALTPGAVTTVIDRLERAGYVRRVRDTEDRRRVLLELTPEAHRATGEIWGPLAADAGRWLASYSDEELTGFIDFLKASREFQEEHLARVRAMKRKA